MRRSIICVENIAESVESDGSRGGGSFNRLDAMVVEAKEILGKLEERVK